MYSGVDIAVLFMIGFFMCLFLIYKTHKECTLKNVPPKEHVLKDFPEHGYRAIRNRRRIYIDIYNEDLYNKYTAERQKK